jgi:Tfp pilus assembly protein PilF
MERIEKLKEFLRQDPGDAFSKHALALEYIKIGDETAARRLFEEILERDPGYTGSYYHLGRLLERGGETALAIDWYVKGMQAAKAAGETRTYNELRAAYEEIVDE